MFISKSFKKDILSNNTNIIPVILIEKLIQKASTYIDPDTGFEETSPAIIEPKGFSTNNLQIKESSNVGGVDNPDIYLRPILLGLPNLKESVDLDKGKYKISSVTLNFSNVDYNGVRMSDLFTNNMLINETVSIHLKSQSCTTITPSLRNVDQSLKDTDCAVLYVGKIRSISHTDQTLTMQLEDYTEQKIHRDLPLIELGDDKNIPDRYKNKPVPMIYGRLNNAPTVAKYVDGKYSIIFDYKDIGGSVTENYYSGFYYDQQNEPIDESWVIGGLKLYDEQYLSVMHNIKHQFVKNEFLNDDPDDLDVELNPDYAPLTIGQTQIIFDSFNNNMIQIENGGLFTRNRLQTLSQSVPNNISFKRLNDNGYSGQQNQEYIDENILSELISENSVTISATSSNVGYVGNIDNNLISQDILFGYRLSSSYGLNGGKYNKLLKFTLNDYNLPVKDIDANIQSSYSWEEKVPHLFSGADNLTGGINPFLYAFYNSFWELTNTEPTTYSDWGVNIIPSEWIIYLSLQYDNNQGSYVPPFALAPNTSEFPNTITTFNDDDYEGLQIGYNYVFNPDRTIKFITSIDTTESIPNDSLTGNCFPVIRFHEGTKSYQDDKADSLSYNIDFLKMYNLSTANGFDINSNICDSQIELNINNIKQYSIVDVEDVTKKDFYVDVQGRLTDNLDDVYYNEEIYFRNPVVIMRDILQNELNVSDFDEEEYEIACEQHQDYQFAFAVDKKTNSKKLIEQISEFTRSYPRIKNNGKFGFVTLKKLYEQTDYENSLLINTDDIINYDFKLTDINQLISSIDVEYEYDYGSKDYLKKYTNSPNMTQQALRFYGIEDLLDNKTTIKTNHTNNSDTVAIIAAEKFYNESAQHLMINIKLPLRYTELEVGSLIKFEKDKLIDGIRAYGMDYTNPIKYGRSYRYPLFLVTEIQRGLDFINISCYQLHKIFDVDSDHTDNHQFWNDTNFPNINLDDPALNISDELLEDVEEGLGDVNLDENVDILDAVMLAAYLLGNTDLSETQLSNADWNQDNNIDITDVISLIQHILGNI
tara:strand:- start:884 stop:4012 length:3129 start_codon:yes stop_codon:yes gene_type:complete